LLWQVKDCCLRNNVDKLSYGELIILGDSGREVFRSTYLCHPSMVNNELSDSVVAAALAKWLLQLDTRRYTYRIVFIPRKIGSMVYLSRHLDHLKKHVIAGFNISCLGYERCFSCIPSRKAA
jgi:aminopeptidase-like protein